jgi:NAD-dependent SIR2 family protein deacetylase
MKEISKIKKLLSEADYILIGAGAGLSTAAGNTYSGERFEKNFKPFIEKYHFKDLYTSGFYNFKTEEEKWAYWSKHIYIANTNLPELPLYKKLFNYFENSKKDYFIITTNVDDCFYKVGFSPNKIFRPQGSYKILQCMYACHPGLYDYTQKVEEMVKNIDEKSCTIPSRLVPKCPKCGGKMFCNIRCDEYFIEGEVFNNGKEKYSEFIKKIQGKKVVLLELGVGFNTPTIIRVPFEKMTSQNENFHLIRFNMDELACTIDLGDKITLVPGDMANSLELILS